MFDRYVVANGLEAVQALEQRTYDIVLMDVQMPEMDGLEAARRITARWSRQERPRILAMTANAMQGDRERCLEAGMDDYIAKPVTWEGLRIWGTPWQPWFWDWAFNGNPDQLQRQRHPTRG